MISSFIPALAQKSTKVWILNRKKETSVLTEKNYEEFQCTADILRFTERTSTFFLFPWFLENKDVLSAYLPDFCAFLVTCMGAPM